MQTVANYTADVSYSFTPLKATVKQISSVPIGMAGLVATNLDSSSNYLQFFNKLAANVTIGTTVADLIIALPASPTNPFHANFNFRPQFSVACSVAATTTATGSTGNTNGVTFAFFGRTPS